jgi:hypothetical protein
MTMVAFSPQLSPRRSAIVAVVMFVLLLACVAAAGWLVWSRTSVPDENGREILAGIRERGLRAFLPGEPTVHWYIGRDADGNAVAWTRQAVEPTEDGFSGTSDLRVRDGWVEAQWSLNAAMDAGEYSSRIRTPDLVQNLTLVQKGNRIEVTREMMDGRQSAAGEAPKTYLPEGTFDVASRLMSRADERAGFYMIADYLPIAGGKLKFTRVTMTPLSENEVRVEYSVLVGGTRASYQFDEAGRIERYSYEGSGDTYERVEDLRVLVSAFGDDRKLLSFPEIQRLRRPPGEVRRGPFRSR